MTLRVELGILGIGTAVPQHTMTQAEAISLAEAICCNTEEQARLLRVLYRRSGVSMRHTSVPHRIAIQWAHSADDEDRATAVHVATHGPTTDERMTLYREHATPLALEAAREALVQARTEAAEITHLVTVSCTGFSAPGVDIDLIHDLELRPTVERVQVGFMGCHGAINGLRAARALAAVDPRAKVLLCAVELCSLHYLFQWDPARMVGNAIFADGAAALVGSQATEDNAVAWRVAATGSCLIPDSTDAMSWRVGDHGFEMSLSPRIPDLIQSHLRPWMERWLAEQGLRLEDIGSWAVHPGGPRIISAVEESLKLPRQAVAVSRRVLAEYGNMSSPTVLFILESMRAAGAARPCVMLGFGPGLVAEAALVR